jgi:hypothetical protein
VADKTSGSKFSRRAMLRGGIISIAVVGVAGAGIALQKTKPRALPKEGLKTLTPDQYAVLYAIAARICPAQSAGVPGIEEIDVALIVDRMLELADPDMKAGLATALGIVESGLAGALFFERVSPFTALSPEDQDRVLIAYRDSSVAVRRTVFRSFSTLLGSVYYGDPRSWPSVGYPGPPSAEGLRVAYAPQLVEWSTLRPAKNAAKPG